MTGIVRKTVIHWFVASSPMLLLVMLLGTLAIFDSSGWQIVLIMRASSQSGWCVFLGLVSGALFGILQLRHDHPWWASDLAKWLILAGWDGRSRPMHLSTTLTGIEVTGALLLAVPESLIQGDLSAGSVLGWAAARVIVLSTRGSTAPQWLYPVWLMGLISTMFLFQPFPMICLAGLTIFLLERIQRRQLAVWAKDSLLSDVESLPSFDKSSNETRLNSRIMQTVHVVDTRPSSKDAIWHAVLSLTFVASVATNLLLTLTAQNSMPSGMESSEQVIIFTMFTAFAACSVFVLRRLHRFDLASWWPDPGIRNRIAQRRPFVWEYDQVLVSTGGPLLVGILILYAWPNPVTATAVCGICVYLQERLGPDPAVWQLTAPARMLRPAEQNSPTTKRK